MFRRRSCRCPPLPAPPPLHRLARREQPKSLDHQPPHGRHFVVHHGQGLTSPSSMADPAPAETWEGIRRTHGVRQKGMKARTSESSERCSLGPAAHSAPPAMARCSSWGSRGPALLGTREPASRGPGPPSGRRHLPPARVEDRPGPQRPRVEIACLLSRRNS